MYAWIYEILFHFFFRKHPIVTCTDLNRNLILGTERFFSCYDDGDYMVKWFHFSTEKRGFYASVVLFSFTQQACVFLSGLLYTTQQRKKAPRRRKKNSSEKKREDALYCNVFFSWNLYRWARTFWFVCNMHVSKYNLMENEKWNGVDTYV